MVRLKLWQWLILATPLIIIISFILIAAGMQIHTWGISWIWAVFTLIFVGWRWLLVKWTKPAVNQIENILAEVREELESHTDNVVLSIGKDTTIQAENALKQILTSAENDAPIWQDLQTFWTRCQDLVVAISHIYYPDVKYPLLNIYVPEAYGLIRGTVDDLDQWMQKLSPVLNQVTIGQAYQAYEIYRKLEPSARKFWQAWNWAQWLLNPVAAVAKKASQGVSNQATQELLGNLNQLLREAALRNLCRQAIILYSGSKIISSTPTLPTPKTQTLRDILSQAEPVEVVAEKPVNILLVGRTGAGKSSLINTLFQADLAEVDVLPSTDKIQNYQWEHQNGEILNLWDTPGYEQVNQGNLRDLVLDYANNADLLLLVTPALDPALQMDVDFLQDIKAEIPDLPVITIITQVDRLRPIREWTPPYNWELGNRPKEISIREATTYRAQILAEFSNLVLPVVTGDINTSRDAWGIEALSWGLVNAVAPAKQLRLTRFLRNLEARTVAAAKIIDHYTFQMATTQGLTALLKSPVLQFISTLSTGSPNLAYLLAEQIPVEQLPIVIGKLQMAYELFPLLNTGNSQAVKFDLLSLWPLLLENTAPSDRNAWAFGHALVEYWTQHLTISQLRERFDFYLKHA
jgi:small GTP-binding protein